MLRPRIAAFAESPWALPIGFLLVTYVGGSLALPRGVPVEVLVPGVIVGGLTSLTAVGLVLIYRSSRIVNFAQANLGGVVATLVALLVYIWHWNFWLAVTVGLAASALLGQQVEQAFMRPFSKAPRLIVTVATIGVAQLLAGLATLLPQWFGATARAGAILPFHSTVSWRVQVGGTSLSGDYLLAAAVVPAVLVALYLYLNRTDAGIAARAAADSQERAQLLGIPVHRLSMITWMIAATLSTLTSLLSAGVAGFQTTLLPGPQALLIPLAAAVVGGFESIGVTVAASIALGVLRQAIFWSYPQSSLVDLLVFAVILTALLLRRRPATRTAGPDLGGFLALAEARPLSEVARALPELRWARVGGFVALLALVALAPLWFSPPALTFSAFVAIFVVVAASLVILTGYGGQVSLGQFAFVGLGAGVTGWLLTSHHVSVLLCLVASTAVGMLTALLLGIPSLRIPGLYLGVVTLAFAVPASTFLLDSSRFPSLAPVRVDPPILFGRYDLSNPAPFYYVCLLLALVSLGVARNFRRARIGRAAVGVRDNERLTSAVGIASVRVRLTTFAVSGAMAGAAGCLYVLADRGVPYGGFSPDLSLQAFTMVVVGGMGSLWGAVLGAVYVYGAQYYLGRWALLVVTGGGIITILRLAPGGLADLGYRARNQLARLVLQRRGISDDALYARPDTATPAPSLRPPSLRHRLERIRSARMAKLRSNFRRDRPDVAVAPDGADRLALQCRGLTAGYGHMQVLFGVDLDVNDGDVFALLGTNGAGKSTILKVVAGVLPATDGQVIANGEDITHLSPAERVKRGLVLVPGGRGVFGSLTVADNLRLGGWVQRRRGNTEYLDATIQRVYELFPVLRERAQQKAALLSGGEQQMLTLAQALLCNPRVLMVDELSLGLAPTVVASLLRDLEQLNQSGITIVLVEQSINIASEVASTSVFLEKGAVRFAGDPRVLAEDADLVRSVFLGDMGKTGSAWSKPTGDRARTQSRSGNDDTGVREPVLEVVGLSKSYGGVTAVQDVDLSLREGEIVGVIGANGAGKSTLFDIVSGLTSADTGRVLLHNRDVTDWSPSARARAGLGRTFQDLRLVPSMTVAELLMLAFDRTHPLPTALGGVFALSASLHAEAGVQVKVEELLETFNLAKFQHAFVSELSTGTRRIVELACVAAHSPSVLILDEPSSGLAQREAEAMADLLLDVKERTGASVAIIEHDIPMIRRLSDAVICMHLGAVIAHGPAAEVLANPNVIASYLGVDEVAVERSGQRDRTAPARRRGGGVGGLRLREST